MNFSFQNVRITDLRLRTVIVPMKAQRSASGGITESPLVLIDITLSNGTIGHSILFTYNRLALKPTASMVYSLREILIGENCEPTAIAEKLALRFKNLGTTGIVGMAISGIDMALWDAISSSAQVSLIRLIGGIEKPIPAYGGIAMDSPRVSAEIAESWVKKGFTGIKIKIGHPTWEEDFAVIREVRAAVGDGISLMVDYNQSLNETEALTRFRLWEQENLVWIEEPLDARDFKGYAKIRSQVNTPVQCGENWWGVQDVELGARERISDYMMFNIMRIGGITGWLKSAAIAEKYNFKVSNHLWPEISAQVLSLTSTRHWLEYTDWWNPILKNPLKVINGYTDNYDVIGTGIEWDEPAVKKFAV